jgi:hypothetical protein
MFKWVLDLNYFSGKYRFLYLPPRSSCIPRCYPCESCIKFKLLVFDSIKPGFSFLRNQCMYHLHVSFFFPLVCTWVKILIYKRFVRKIVFTYRKIKKLCEICTSLFKGCFSKDLVRWCHYIVTLENTDIMLISC